MWLDISEKFHSETIFPNCVGEVDGKVIRCINPRRKLSNYYNYKKYFPLLTSDYKAPYTRTTRSRRCCRVYKGLSGASL
ncbi:hypothetical protein PR048_005159 [Dryococelus australis]|uniref:DDE Tnp4 domain-containing protein n=1 Tax=Dryococelus australis TaxID=614101 RepID=A0ABQ9I7E8_9NEOP|nr:hypothetical protein PR048_005159 [Dryococelus australis]